MRHLEKPGTTLDNQGKRTDNVMGVETVGTRAQRQAVTVAVGNRSTVGLLNQ